MPDRPDLTDAALAEAVELARDVVSSVHGGDPTPTAFRLATMVLVLVPEVRRLREVAGLPWASHQLEMRRLRDALSAEQAMRERAESDLTTARVELTRVQAERDQWRQIASDAGFGSPPPREPGWAPAENHAHAVFIPNPERAP